MQRLPRYIFHLVKRYNTLQAKAISHVLTAGLGSLNFSHHIPTNRFKNVD